MRLMIGDDDLVKGFDSDFSKLRLFDKTPKTAAIWKEHRADLVKSFDVVNVIKTDKGRRITLECNPRYFLWQDGNVWRHLDCNLDQGGVNVLAYSEEQWFYYYDTVKSTGERYHPGYKHLCSVLFNDFKNPVILDPDTACRRYIDRIAVDKESESDIVFKFGVTSCAIESNEIVFSNEEEYTIIQKQGSYPTLLINDKVTTAALDLIELMTLLENQFYYKKCVSHHKDYMVVYRLLEPVINAWVVKEQMRPDQDKVSVRLKNQLAKLHNNRRLYNLPFSEIELIGLYNTYQYSYSRREVSGFDVLKNINKRLANNDSKQAINACFYGHEYPKCIRKLLLQAGLLLFAENTYRLIARAVAARGVDRTREFITNPYKNNSLDLEVLEDRVLLSGFTLGWNLKQYRQMQTNPNKSGQEKSRLKSLEVLLKDTIRMQNYILRNKGEIQIKSNNVKEIHDYLMPIYSLFINSERGAEMEAFKTVSTQDQLAPLLVDGFILRSPYTAAELMTVGEQMKHCVAAYTSNFYYRKIEIAVLTDSEGVYLVCLEIKNSYVIQAKMKYNAAVRKNSQYLKMVMDFIALNNLKICTEDISDTADNDDSWEGFQSRYIPKDESRIEIVKALEEKEKQKAAALF